MIKPTLLMLSLVGGGLMTMRALTDIELVPENGVVSAKTLPLDEETSKIAFETATFGLG